MSDPELLLSNQLCFMIHRIDRALGARYRPLLAELGLTYPQYLAMLSLWEHERLTIGRLCELLALDTGTVSPLVKRLEGAGLVTRSRSDEDERTVFAELTPKGKALRKKAKSVPGAIASCAVSSKGEYDRLRETLEGLLERLVRDA